MKATPIDNPIRNVILDADDRPLEELYIPEWDVTVYIAAMCGSGRDRFEIEVMWWGREKTTDNNFRAKLAVKTVCDKDGNLIFSDADAEKLGQKSAKALDRILKVAKRLNGLSAEDVEELEKN